jgi:hypothetical protein
MRHRLGEPLPHQLADTKSPAPRPADLWESNHAEGLRYLVLPILSDSYPRVRGTLAIHYSPVRHCAAYCYATPYDLHVLTTPPAFRLSQNQTLQLNFLAGGILLHSVIIADLTATDDFTNLLSSKRVCSTLQQKTYVEGMLLPRNRL